MELKTLCKKLLNEGEHDVRDVACDYINWLIHLQAWTFMLELRCPPILMSDWESLVDSILSPAMYDLTLEDKCSLFCEYEVEEDTPDLLNDILRTQLLKAMKIQVFNSSGGEVRVSTGVICYS